MFDKEVRVGGLTFDECGDNVINNLGVGVTVYATVLPEIKTIKFKTSSFGASRDLDTGSPLI